MKMQFESSTACNANCIFCPRSKMKRKHGEMSDELFHKIIRESKRFKKAEIVPFLNGEPFIFSRIWEWLDHMEKNNSRVYLFTNAEFIDVDRIIKYKNIRYICCSINAATKETYNKVVRGPDFDKVVANVKDLIKKAPFRIYVSMVAVDANKHEMEAFRKMWGNYGMIGEFKNWGGDMHDKIERTGVRKPCLSMLRTITILWDGKVVPCCLDYEGKLVLADANKDSFPEILKKSEWLRNKHFALDFSMIPCKNCNQNIYENL